MKALFTLLLSLVLIQCSRNNDSQPGDVKFLKENPPMLSGNSYAMNSDPVLIKGARIMTATGVVYEKANLLMSAGVIKKVSPDKIDAPQGTEVIEADGMTLTPGLIDIHSHMGVYPSPTVDAHSDGNESTNPVTSQVWAEHGFWPQDPDLWRAMAGGITTIQVLPGSANLIGGRSFTAKLIPQLSAREMRFNEAPQGLKMACGENPKRVYQDKGLKSRMGNVAGYRKAYQEALEYARQWAEYKKGQGKIPKRNFVSETLVKVLKGEILVHFHCYRADDISAILDVAKEFGFEIRTIHHGLEAYKIAPRLAKEKVSVATWADWWGFKAEAYDGVPYNVALLQKAGGIPIIHSDSATEIRFLNVEAGKALSSAKKLGLNFSEDEALQWVTKNAAWAIGVNDKIGTIEEGKMGDVVLWDGHPFSVYTKASMVFINGKKVFDREKKERFLSDFEVGFQDGAFHDGREATKTSTIKNISWPDTSLQTRATPMNEFYIDGAHAFIEGRWVKKTKIHVKNGVVIAINPPEKPKSVPVIEAENMWLTPGLIESSSSLGLFEIEIDSKAQDLGAPGDKPSPDFKAIDSLNTRNVRLANKRQEGVLTSIAGMSSSYASSMAVAFDLAENLIVKPEAALFGKVEKSWELFGDKKHESSRSAIWSQLRQFVDDAKLYLKNPKEFNKGDARSTFASSRHLKAMGPILAGKKPWVLTANRASDIRNIIQLKKDNPKIKPVIRGATEAWLVAKLLKENNIPVMVAPSMQTPITFNKTLARFDQAAFLHKEGVELIIYDASTLGAARTRQEAGLAVKYGLSKEAALRAITETPAKVFGLKRGKIEKGATANLVLWNGDPLEPTSWAKKIWIQGKDTSLMNRHRALAEKYLQK